MTGKDLSNQEKLEEVYEMTLQNNHILRSLRRQQYIGNAFRLLYWLVILGALGGVYIYARPVINSFTGGKTEGDDTFKQLEILRSEMPDAKILEQVLKYLKGETSTTTTAEPTLATTTEPDQAVTQ